MARSSTTAPQSAARRASMALADDLDALMRALNDLVDPYRPEQHYMRGPGPKWHAKHDPQETDINGHIVPAPLPTKG